MVGGLPVWVCAEAVDFRLGIDGLALRVQGGRFLLCWIIPSWILFELVATKLPHYVLPTFPALALMAAAALFAPDAKPFRFGKVAFWLLAAVWLAVSFVLTFLAPIGLMQTEHRTSIIAFVLAALGWLWDARREYAATEAADRTGHLDLGGAPAWPKGTFAALALLVALGLALTTGLIGGSGDEGTATASGAPGASVAPGAGGGEASAVPSAGPDADVVITALNVNWVVADVIVPADTPFTLALDNQDNAVPHDVVITDGSGAEVFRTELVTGPAVVVYDVPAISPGQYAFVCTVHPNMTGTVTAQ